MDFAKSVPFLIETASFITAFAVITSAIITIRFIRKLPADFPAMGFKAIGIGILVLAAGIIADAINISIQTMQSSIEINALLIIRQALFMVGAYVVVIGVKIWEEANRNTFRT